ncbi:MAG: zf-HC2 domain-containing protein [candidate division WOR-3 bacterium]
MMRHKKILDLIEKKLDREITQEELVKLNEHLKECPQCLNYYNEMEDLCQDIFELTEFFPRIDFNDRVLLTLNIRRKAWYKLVPILGFVYLSGLVILVLTPIGHRSLASVLHFSFWVFKIFGKIKPIAIELSNIVIHFSRFHFLTFVYIFISVIILFYFFGKIFKEKEALCN